MDIGANAAQIWIENHPTEGWVPGRVDAVNPDGSVCVVDDHGQQFQVAADKKRPVDSACLKGVDDLLSLGDFNEGALLHNVRVRYFRDEIYTGIGGPILISVNPFMKIPDLYSEARQKFYRDRSAAAGKGDVELPPHLFSVGAASYTAMLGDSKNQSIIISGESGAGKTEATKRILTYFAGLQRQGQAADPSGMGIEDQILRSNPILEGFGNAKTVRNDNSSRFGKFIDIEFDNSGKLRSAKISNYLLEKSRIVTQQPSERNYHAFYMLCAGAASLDISSMLNLHDARDFAYTCGTTEVSGVDDRDDFQEMTECMTSLGFSTEERESIFKITAAVLHLGDLEFEEMANSDEGTRITNQDRAEMIRKLMHVDLKDFTKVYQYKTLEDPFTKKIIDMPQNPTGSSDTRHSMAKCLYSRLFDWLVWRINESTKGSKSGGGGSTRKIGILDIYGFEVFEWNSFEQLCINFANEKLQQHFNSHMFTLEQQLYNEEGISWSHIVFQDNREIIDSLEKKPLGLFCILDSECLMPNGKDATCLNKIYSSFKTSKIVYKPSRFADTNFAVAHYAGPVIYDIVSFLEKNTDKLHADIINLGKSSGMSMLKSLFADAKFAPELRDGGASKAAAKSRASPAPRGKEGGERAKQNVTVSMMFRSQLDQLVDDLNQTNPRYVRCIKPNGNKQPHDFDSLEIQRQLRCAGMLESIRIRRAGYSVRRPFKEFFNRFRILTPNISTGGRVDPDYKAICSNMLQQIEARFEGDGQPLEPKSWQVGRSKVFMKDDMQTKLEKSMAGAIQKYVIRIQRRARGFVMRRRYKAMRKAIGELQSALRTMGARSAFLERLRQHNACVGVQAALRMFVMQKLFAQKRAAVVLIQKRLRGWHTRRKIGKLKGKNAAERIKKQREEEEQKAEMERLKKAQQEREREMEDMKRRMEEERQRAQEEAEKKMLEMSKSFRMNDIADMQEKALKEREEVEKLRQDVLEMRKENARLQGALDAGPGAGGVGVTPDVEVEALRRELDDLRRDKAGLQVELATRRSAEEFEAVATEAGSLREELSNMRREKLETECQLERQQAELEFAKAQAERAGASSSELSDMRSRNDELQVQLQRAQAQKSALEERCSSDDVARQELRELKVEKLRLESELECSKMREEAIAEKLRGSGASPGRGSSLELLQAQQRASALEAELEAAKAQVGRLGEQLSKITQDSSAARNDSLDSLRSELLSRIERPVESRPSIMRMPGTGDLGDVGEAGEGVQERKTLLNQRALFEQIRKQFDEAKGPVQAADVDEMALGTENSILELEEELKATRKDNVELGVKLAKIEDELRMQGIDATRALQKSGQSVAEVEDIKMQLDQEAAAARRYAAEVAELQAQLSITEGELDSLRKRLLTAEETLVRNEEDAKAAIQKARYLEEERESLERRVREVQVQASEWEVREREVREQLDIEQQLVEQCRRAATDAERLRVESESNAQWLESENQRIKAELGDANNERVKIKQVVEELMRTHGEGRGAELQNEVEKWRKRASYFEREYNNSKQLNAEMTKVMSQMTQAVSERSDQNSEASGQIRLLKGQLEAKVQELKSAKGERDEVQRQLDSLNSAGSYFQDKYREASDELRTLRQEHSVATATSSKMRVRVESLQKECEDLKAQQGRLAAEARSGIDDSMRISQYDVQIKELQTKLRRQDEELDRSQAFAAKSQAVNDCLNTLLVLESEQTSLYEMACPINDQALQDQFNSKKSKAQNVISRLNEIMTEEERPSIAFLQRR